MTTGSLDCGACLEQGRSTGGGTSGGSCVGRPDRRIVHLCCTTEQPLAQHSCLAQIWDERVVTVADKGPRDRQGLASTARIKRLDYR